MFLTFVFGVGKEAPMFSVRIHGRGGQGAVTAAEMLSVAAFDEGRHAQAFPTFGQETPREIPQPGGLRTFRPRPQ